MGEFLLWSLIASVGLTILFNLAFLMFPDLVDRTERNLSNAIIDTGTPDRWGGVGILFPIKFILAASILLTILFNLGAIFLS